HGHQVGDEVLKKLGQLLGQGVRATDIACRFGGEEFLVLLPNMSGDIAFERAEQWRQAFAGTPTELGPLQVTATLSIGIATFPVHGMEPQELIHHADQAMYQAKALGRNRVVAY
ncbi:MAG: diguanylate cyclase, partial [Comamonadaceae bacterium]